MEDQDKYLQKLTKNEYPQYTKACLLQINMKKDRQANRKMGIESKQAITEKREKNNKLMKR